MFTLAAIVVAFVPRSIDKIVSPGELLSSLNANRLKSRALSAAPFAAIRVMGKSKTIEEKKTIEL